LDNISSYNSVWSLWERNSKNAPDKDAIVHWLATDEPIRWSYSDLIKKANQVSATLKKLGIRRNQVVAIIIKHNPLFYPVYFGIAGLGAIPAVLAYPNPRLHPDKFRSGIIGMSQRSGLDYILTQRDIEPVIAPLLEPGKTTINGLFFPEEWDLNDAVWESEKEEITVIRNSIKPEDPFLLQHSSGTTGLQKPVLLSQRAIIEHVKYYSEAIKLTQEDKIASWLPLYHDMGLIAAYHLPLAYGITSVQIDPFEWVLAPSLLTEVIGKEKATLTWLPNFAYNFMAERIEDDELEGIRLDTLRMAINCSEPVRNESHVRFYERFKDFGIRKTALTACYAMAETTYGVTQTPPDEEPKLMIVDRDELAAGRVSPAIEGKASRVCVSSGMAIEGCSVRIVDSERKEVAPGMVGEIAISSVSMFDGYRNYPEKTAEVLIDGWYYSGDYGFMVEDELFVIGRKKDIIIVAGKNIYPEDVEDAVGKVPDVLPGRVIAFGYDNTDLGTEEVSVVAETGIEDEHGKKDLTKRIKEAGLAIDVSITHVFLVPPRWLIKSSAGKPSRSANKQRISEMIANNEKI